MNEEDRFWFLLAENNESDARPLRELLKFRGLKCKHAFTAEDALKYVQEDITNPPLMMILDIRLPTSLYEGITVAQDVWTLQQKHQLNPTFALFISVLDEDHLRAGFEVLSQRFQNLFPDHPRQWRFIQKPISIVQLDAIVLSIMENSQKED